MIKDPEVDGPAAAKRLADAEQEDFLAFAKGLTQEQWQAPSLCDGLSTRDIVVHVASHFIREPSLSTGVAMFTRGGFSLIRTGKLLDDWQRQRYESLSTEDVIALLSSPIAVGTRFARRFRRALVVQRLTEADVLNQLSEMVIHQQDVRRALDLPRVIAPDRLRAVLDFNMTRLGELFVGLPRIVRGLRLVATDFEWTAGVGAEVTGPGEALLMARAGRVQALVDLSGPGCKTLAQRIKAFSAKAEAA
jgi:uncharacterized protein (TIGR03083 family)